MNENINLCEILKGHEGETFYSPCYGFVYFKEIRSEYPFPICCINKYDSNINFTKYGKISVNENTECVIFPSKDQRDWNKWTEEQKPKVPKIWNEMTSKYCNVEVWQHISHIDYGSTEPIVKSAASLLKIHQLIEAGYGGNPSNEELGSEDIYYISYYIPNKELLVTDGGLYKSHIAFHTKEQAEEFLSYPENVQLLKDYFMI